MKTQALRQRIRKTLLLVALIAFPAVYFYLSPYLIVEAAREGVINGSFIIFTGVQFLSSLLFGRLWCGWCCPAGGLHQACRMVNDRPARGGKLNWIKYGIWLPWVILIGMMARAAGGFQRIDFFYRTEQGFSAVDPFSYILFFIIAAALASIALFFGRMAPCHYICWMAPFMVIGTTIKNAVKWPSLHLRAAPETCTGCTLCTKNCPMSLDVNGMVRKGSMKNAECIMCGECVDNCPADTICYSFGRPQ